LQKRINNNNEIWILHILIPLSPSLSLNHQAIPLIYGQAGLLPFPTHVTAVVGEPIKTKQCASPTNEQVNEMHQLYMQKLKELFDENKANHGAPDAVLEIM
jgi:2-acylglycerol O-acyltransferase 1